MNNVQLVFLVFFSSVTFSIFWPLFTNLKSNFYKIGIVVNFITIAISLFFIANLYFSASESARYAWAIYSDFEIILRANKLGLILTILLIFLWPAAYLYSYGYLIATKEKNIARFIFFLNLSFIFGIYFSFSNNLLSMFIFYEMVTLSTIPLVAHNYTTHVNKALKKYIAYLFILSSCLLIPIILYLSNAGIKEFGEVNNQFLLSLDDKIVAAIILMVIYGFAKAAIFPAHGWLPSAMAANYPTSGILHGVLVVNIGIFSIAKFIFEIIGTDIIENFINQFKYVIYLPVIGIIYSGLLALFQDTAKKILAWSTVANLNLMMLIILSGMKNSLSLFVIFLIMHSFTKLTLFFSCGVIYSVTRATRIEEFAGSFKKLPLISIILAFASIIMTGLSLGFLGKLKEILVFVSSSQRVYPLSISLIISSFFSVIYFSKIIIAIFAKCDQVEIHGKGNLYMILPTIYVFILCVIMNVYIVDIYNILYGVLY